MGFARCFRGCSSCNKSCGKITMNSPMLNRFLHRWAHLKFHISTALICQELFPHLHGALGDQDHRVLFGVFCGRHGDGTVQRTGKAEQLDMTSTEICTNLNKRMMKLMKQSWCSRCTCFLASSAAVLIYVQGLQ